MKENLIHYRTCVCNINYHMVWSVKYRQKILNQEIEEYLQELVQQIVEDKGFTVHEQVAKRTWNIRLAALLCN
nr:transposase [uncultured Blautia sp.]